MTPTRPPKRGKGGRRPHDAQVDEFLAFFKAETDSPAENISTGDPPVDNSKTIQALKVEKRVNSWLCARNIEKGLSTDKQTEFFAGKRHHVRLRLESQKSLASGATTPTQCSFGLFGSGIELATPSRLVERRNRFKLSAGDLSVDTTPTLVIQKTTSATSEAKKTQTSSTLQDFSTAVAPFLGGLDAQREILSSQSIFFQKS